MALFFKKTTNAANQKPISQHTVQSLVKKAVDGISSKFDQNIIDQIFLTLKTKKGCEFVIKSLIDIINQDSDNDTSIFKALKVFYLCLITNSGFFRSYAQMCMPEIATISLLSFKKTSSNKFRNEVKIFSQQIYLNLALSTPLPSPNQLKLDKFVQSQAFLSVYERIDINKSESLKEKETVKPEETEYQKLINVNNQKVPLSNCQFVENLIEFDFSNEKPPVNNENATGNDNDIFSFSSSSPNKDSDHEIQNTKSQNPASPTKITANTEDLYQNIREKKDYFESLIPQNENKAPSITQSTPKLLDLIQQPQDEQFVPHKRSREKSYDPPKSDFDFLNFIDNEFNTTTDKKINETVNNDNDKISNEYVQTENDNANNDNSNLNSYIQPSMRSQSYHVFNNSKGSNAGENADDKCPLAKQISSDSPSDAISGPSKSLDNQDDNINSKNFEGDQNYEIPPNSFLDNKSRSYSLEHFPSSNSLPTKSSTTKPVDQIPVKAVRFPTSPNLKDFQNKSSISISSQKTVNFTSTENQKNDLDFLGLPNSTATISKSKPANDILDLSASTNSPNDNDINFLDISSSEKEVNNTDKNNNADILDLSSTSSSNKNKQKSNNDDEIYDLSPTNQKNTNEIFDLSNSSANISANASNNDDILDFSNTVNTSQTNNNNNIDILELATSPNKNSNSSNNKNNDIDILDLSGAPSNPISKNSTNDEIDIITLANSANNINLIPISNIPNMSIPHLQQSASTDELISITNTNNHSKTADKLLPNNDNNNRFNQISTPPFIPQSPSANIPFRIHRTNLHDNTNNDFNSLVSIGTHQRSYSNTTPVPTSRITDSIQKTTQQQQLIGNNNSNNISENTSISLIESSQDEDIIPLIETKSKASTISASAPYMLQNQSQSFEVGNSALVPTSDSPLYSQGKRKDTKVKRFTISYNLESEDGTSENRSKLILPSSSFSPSSKDTVHSIFSNSESSYNSFSSSDTKQQNYMQNTVLETIIEEDETNDQFVPISGRSEEGFDDNFEPIPMDDSKGENDKFDDSFEPIVNEEEENLDSNLDFVPISPREGEIDEGFEPIEQNNKEDCQQFEPIDSNDPLFESINSVNNDQFEPIYKSENNIYDQFEPIGATDSIDSNKFESINGIDKNNNDDDDSRQVEIEIDGFEPIQNNDNNSNDNDNFEPINNNNNKQIDIENDNFEPINDSNQQTEIENDNFELISNDKQIENEYFEPIESNNKLDIDNFMPIQSNINNNSSFEPIENDNMMSRQIKIESSNNQSNSSAKFCSVSSDGVVLPPQVKARTKKFNVKKIHSLQNIPAISLDIFNNQQSKVSPSIITEDKNS